MRIRTLQIFFTAFFILLCARMFYLQIVRGNLYKEMSYKNSIRLLSIDAPRGSIYDRQGRVLARDRVSFGVFIVPQEAKGLGSELKKLAGILGVQESLLKRNYKRNYQAAFAPCELVKNISKKKAILIEELKLDMPGVLVKEIAVRSYPYRDALAHVVGYTGEIGREELTALRNYGYAVKDIIGKDGVEKAFDAVLRGKNGGMQIQVDSVGRQVGVLGSKMPIKGKDVYLTIDAGLQDFVWRMMRGKRGAAIFINPANGEILSMVSTPSYNPNLPLARALKGKGEPFLNRAIMGQYPAGSLFKVVVALAGLETGRIRPATTFVCTGRLDVGDTVFNCWKRDGHGRMDIKRAIIESCNVFFYNTGLLLGVEKISEYAMEFGLGSRSGVELSGEAKGLVPSRAWKRTEKKEPWYAGDTANLSIGQGYLLVTPLQIARLYASVANSGGLVKPHLLKRIGNGKPKIYRKAALRIKKENIELVKKGLKGVIEDEDGTGFRAWSSIVSISGKTGTAQAGRGLRAHAWFAGYAPSEAPEISFVIFLEHGGSGGDIAALIGRKAVEYWYRNRQR